MFLQTQMPFYCDQWVKHSLHLYTINPVCMYVCLLYNNFKPCSPIVPENFAESQHQAVLTHRHRHGRRVVGSIAYIQVGEGRPSSARGFGEVCLLVKYYLGSSAVMGRWWNRHQDTQEGGRVRWRTSRSTKWFLLAMAVPFPVFLVNPGGTFGRSFRNLIDLKAASLMPR